MISDDECKRRELKKAEEEKARERISGPVKHLMPMVMPTIGREFDTKDPKTRLICEKPVPGHSYWRTEEGDYIKLILNDWGGAPAVINTTIVQEMMNRRKRAYTWYITEAEVEELIEDDKRIERKRSLGF